MAVFNEVLSITVNDTMFQAEMTKIEGIYAASLSKMDSIGNVGQFGAASAFREAADSINESAVRISAAVEGMSAEVGEAMARMATKTKVASDETSAALRSTGRAAFEGGLDMNRFATGFESAMYRIPGRMAVLALLAAAVAAVVVPFKLLKDGFEALASSSVEFKTVHTQLADLASVFEQVAAKPLFTLILNQMERLAKWLQDNKAYVDNLANGFGKLVESFVSMFVEFGQLDAVKTGFKDLAAIVIHLASGLADVINNFVTLGALAKTGLDQENKNIKEKGFVKGTLQNWGNFLGIGAQTQEEQGNNQILDAFVKNAHTIADAKKTALDALNNVGPGAQLETGLSPKSQEATLKETMEMYHTEQEKLRADFKSTTDANDEAVHHQRMTREQEGLAKEAAADAWVEKQKKLEADTLKKLPSQANISILNDSAYRTEAMKLQASILGGGGPTDFMTQALNAKKKAVNEVYDYQRKTNEEEFKEKEKEIKGTYELEIKTAKEAASAKRETNVAAIGQEKEAVNERFQAELTAAGNLKGGVPGSDDQTLKTKAIIAAIFEWRNALKELSVEETKSAETDQKAQEAHERSVKATMDITEKAAMAEAKFRGDKRTEQALQAHDDAANIQALQNELAKVQGEQVVPLSPEATDKEDRINKLQAQIQALREQLVRDTTGANAPAAVNLEQNLSVAEAIAKANSEEAKLIGNKHKELEANLELLKVEEQRARLTQEQARAELARVVSNPASTASEIQNVLSKVAVANAAQATKTESLQIATTNATTGGQAAASFGVNLGQMNAQLQDINPTLANFSTAIVGTLAALGQLAKGVTEFITQLHSGNIGGAIGTGLSTVAKGAGEAASKIADNVSNSDAVAGALQGISSVAGALGPVVSGVMGVVTGLFETSIQNMVTDIQNQVSNINLAAQTKQIGILEQITQLKQEEQTAISELGGKKKAKSQLNAILQSLNQEIAQLQYQAQQTIQQFNDMVEAANTGIAAGNQVASQWLQTWQSINAQVEAYIQAGGSAVIAAQYYNQQLQQQQQQLQNQVNSGNATAIQDALQLNQLELNKVDLMKQEAATEFGLLNSDSLERNVASAVATGNALTIQRDAYAQQLTQMNYQITTEQLKVAAESQIFDLAQNTAALQAQSNALTLASLQQQLLAYQEMQKIIQSTTGLAFTPTTINPSAGLQGTQAPIPGMPNVNGVSGATVGTINVTINGNATVDNVQSLGSAIASNIRSGRTTFALPGSAS